MGVYFQKSKTLKEKKLEANQRIGSKIKSIRKSMKMTQKQFAGEYNIKGGNSAVSKIENGKRSMPADLLPVIAEDGNKIVEQFYRDDVYFVKNVFYDCLSKMNIEKEHIEPIMSYIGFMTDSAIENIGVAKLFDLMFAIIRTASSKDNYKGRMMDEINLIDWDNYDNNNSRYINYIKEMAIYNDKI